MEKLDYYIKLRIRLPLIDYRVYIIKGLRERPNYSRNMYHMNCPVSV